MSKSLLFQIVKQILVNLVVHLFLWEAVFGQWNIVPHPPPRDTQLPFDMLFITMFYTCHVKEVVYHKEEQLRIRKSLKLYIVLYRNTMKNIKISLNKIWYTYTALIPKNMMLSLLNKCKFWFKWVSLTNDQNTGEGCTVYRSMSFAKWSLDDTLVTSAGLHLMCISIWFYMLWHGIFEWVKAILVLNICWLIIP